MVKKPVPDWLNSSLWSSAPPPGPPSPDDDHLLAHHPSKSSSSATSSSSAPKPATVSSAAAESQVKPPLPVPPPSAVRTEPPKAEMRDPLNDHNSDNGSSGSPSAEDISRQAQLLQELSRKVINMGELRRLASQGIPDVAGIRSTVWKLLLGYLPTDRGLWSSEFAKKRSQYKHFKEDLLMNPMSGSSLSTPFKKLKRVRRTYLPMEEGSEYSRPHFRKITQLFELLAGGL